MEDSTLTLCDSASSILKARYEELRSEVLGSWAKEGNKSQGFVLFLRQGMIGWLQAWSKCRLLTAREKSKEPIRSNWSVDLRAQLAILLTTMALNVWQEVKSYDE